MAQLALSIEGFAVTTAGDGFKGLQVLESQTFDAIVLDLQMPKLDGPGFLRAIRERQIMTPVVIVSAYETAIARSELGAQASIKKPFEPEVLVAALRQVLAPKADSEPLAVS
jgi:DNA-binding response OmpR family regulator